MSPSSHVPETAAEASGPAALRRRTVLGGGAAAGVLAASALTAEPASAGGHGHGHPSPGTARLTVLGTTDLHGNGLNWDYYKDAEYDDANHDDIGLAKISTLVTQQRAAAGAREVL